jgi:iron complex outermembrane receptor protein
MMTRGRGAPSRWMILLGSTAVAAFAYGAVGAKAQSAPPQTAVAQGQTVAFSIPPQPLKSAIVSFSRAAGIDVVFDGSIPETARTKGVSGTFTISEALSRLLAGTGFSAQANGRTVRLVSRAASGQTAGAAPAGSIPLDTIDVQGSGDGTVGYVATRDSVGTKTNAPLISTPQAISVVTRQQMDDQDVQTVSQALRYTSGVLPEQRGVNEMGLEYLYGRGFLLDTYLDGLRLPSANNGTTGYNLVSVDPYLLQSIQVLHGPASILYGQASPGGVVDLVSKMPTTDPIHELTFQTGSYGRLEGGFDFGGPLDASGQYLYRLTGTGLDTGTQIDQVRNERVAIAPAFTWRPDGSTTLTVLASYLNAPNAGYYNFLPAQGTVLPNIYGRIPFSFNPGEPGFDQHSLTQASIGYQFEHRFNEALTVRQNFRYQSVDDHFQNVFGFGIESDPAMLGRYAFVNNENIDYLTVDNQAQIDANTGALHHTLLFGLDYTHTVGDEAYGLGSAPAINMFTPIYGAYVATPAYSGYEHFTQDRLGLYAQDQITFDRLHILIGGRQDWYGASDNNIISDTLTKQSDQPFTWRAGLVYELNNGLAPYFSYSTSFQPDESTNYAGAFLPPQTAQQYEAGIKYQPKGFNGFLTAAVYNLTEQNVPTEDPDHPAFDIATGEIRSRGVELEAHASVTDNINLIATYTYVDALVTKSTTDDLGMVPTGIPKNMASVWGTYVFNTGALRGLQLGAGVRYVGDSWGTETNTFKVPAYTLVDAAMKYDLGGINPALKNWSASVNATNLFNKQYVASCAFETNCIYGLGRMVLAKLTVRW